MNATAGAGAAAASGEAAPSETTPSETTPSGTPSPPTAAVPSAAAAPPSAATPAAPSSSAFFFAASAAACAAASWPSASSSLSLPPTLCVFLWRTKCTPKRTSCSGSSSSGSSSQSDSSQSDTSSSSESAYWSRRRARRLRFLARRSSNLARARCPRCAERCSSSTMRRMALRNCSWSSSSLDSRSLASNSLPLHTLRVISASASVRPSLASTSSSTFCFRVFSSNSLKRAWSAFRRSSMIFFCASVSSLSSSSHAPASRGLHATFEGAAFSSAGAARGACGIATSAMGVSGERAPRRARGSKARSGGEVRVERGLDDALDECGNRACVSFPARVSQWTRVVVFSNEGKQ